MDFWYGLYGTYSAIIYLLNEIMLAIINHVNLSHDMVVFLLGSS